MLQCQSEQNSFSSKRRQTPPFSHLEKPAKNKTSSLFVFTWTKRKKIVNAVAYDFFPKARELKRSYAPWPQSIYLLQSIYAIPKITDRSLNSELLCKFHTEVAVAVYFDFWFKKCPNVSSIQIPKVCLGVSAAVELRKRLEKLVHYRGYRVLIRAGATNAAAPVNFWQRVHAPINYQDCYFSYNFLHTFSC